MNLTLAHMMRLLIAAQVAVLELGVAAARDDNEQECKREFDALTMCIRNADVQLTLIRKQVKQGTL